MAQAETIDVVRDAVSKWTPVVRRIMSTRAFCCVVLCIWPLLLVNLLHYGRWRSDHPPLSNADLMLKWELSKTSSLSIGGDLSWPRLTGIAFGNGFIIKNRATLRQFAETLRCTDQLEPISSELSNPTHIFPPPPPRFIIFLIIPDEKGEIRPYDGGTYFQYSHYEDASYLYCSLSATKRRRGVRVHSRFAKKFENLIFRLASQAQAEGKTTKTFGLNNMYY